jgi:hypothetical protein
MALPI